MENSNQRNILRFLSEQEKFTEQRLHELNFILENEFQCPDHILDTLHQLRQNAEDDLSNILHLQSIYPGRSAKSGSVKSPSRRMQIVAKPGVDLGNVDEEAGVETGEVVLADDDMFALDGVAGAAAGLHSDEEREEHDSEADEGIHIPSKFRHRNVQPAEVAASLPVGIPWPSQMTAGTAADRQQLRQLGDGYGEDDDARPTDIAASIQALAKSVHTSSIFGDNVFGELPRPRTNTYGKKTNK